MALLVLFSDNMARTTLQIPTPRDALTSRAGNL